MTSDSKADGLFSVEGRVIIVTGGMGQLGRQFSHALLKRGAKVAVFDKNACRESLVKASDSRKGAENLLCLTIDITSKASIKNGLNQVVGKWGIPDGLINNAAIDAPPNAPPQENGPFETYPELSWDKIMEVNVKGIFLCSQVIGGSMAIARKGSIVNISSIYGLISPDQRIYAYRSEGKQKFFKPVAYSTSKSALLNLTRYLATYWTNRNIRVNTLTLGGVFNHQDNNFLKGYCSRVPLGRMACEDEYNGAVIFLLSRASSYMTGANLVIDGGWTAW